MLSDNGRRRDAFRLVTTQYCSVEFFYFQININAEKSNVCFLSVDVHNCHQRAVCPHSFVFLPYLHNPPMAITSQNFDFLDSLYVSHYAFIYLFFNLRVHNSMLQLSYEFNFCTFTNFTFKELTFNIVLIYLTFW